MVTTIYLICISSLIVSEITARPEAALPYFYNNPTDLRANNVPNFGNFQPSAAVSQHYLPSENFKSQQQTFSNVPIDSYGVPVASTFGQLQSTNILPNRNYGTPDLHLSGQSPVGAIRNQPTPLVNVQKHIYVHVPPPDVEEERIQRLQQQNLRQKHYKIIFVKVPSYPSTAQYLAQQQALQEEKTLIYVLVKKPEDLEEIRANQISSTPVNKPEVYFIKYRAKAQQNRGQISENQGNTFQKQSDDSVVVDSADKGQQTNFLGQGGGYNYNRPSAILK
ncbi:uncharacterized protein LOC126739103 [Anthonomus grandis grandis]|uniref:uncharacterized protein LOC126739103 n=1 Tax=Anthonomus grandis grandis TaxID=2921223 RepID=UPI002165CAD6|nr:uncharacterized protein LOC126739103 [Anthonomus grandis grandis]